ncbi:flagellar biosynthetic protein FliQ [Azospirillum sp. ST 5-10]|uniref:flagellar biosynthetic protein FliQ n=1 Tax=unclassified Azospirillum TaxID=2630922 RepID=UPI003F4A74B3
MGVPEAIAASYEALIVIIKISMPALLVSTAIGLVVTLFQAVTHIQDPNLQQQLKIFATIAVLFVTAPAIYIALHDYTMLIFDRIANLN